MEQPRIDVDSANFRLMIITSFLVASTMVLLTLNVSIVRQSAAAERLGTVEWFLAASVMLMLLPSLIVLLLSSVML